VNSVRRFAEHSHHLVVARVPDQHNVVTFGGKAHGLAMDFGDQRTGRVDRAKTALGGFRTHLRRDAVGGKEKHRTGRHVVQSLDEYGALRAKTVDNPTVVHDFMENVHRRAVQFERAAQAVDRHIHAGAKTARRNQNDLHRIFTCPPL